MKNIELVQTGLRIEKSLLKKIEKLSQDEGVDRMSWMRRALSTFVKGEENGMKEEAFEDYILLRIDEDELKEILNIKKIPTDIQEARKAKIKQILEVKTDGKDIHK